MERFLTAHPTEVIRRTLIRKYDAIADTLAERDVQPSSLQPELDERLARPGGGGPAPTITSVRPTTRPSGASPSSSTRSGRRCRGSCAGSTRDLATVGDPGRLPLDAAPVRLQPS
ncbi:MAG: phosphoenolpyruvate carboxylase [Gammaproteobacteria bacterium]|nr:phosphoenolpyruvate carboxylase [Gammaproteobacteria bacterium]